MSPTFANASMNFAYYGLIPFLEGHVPAPPVSDAHAVAEWEKNRAFALHALQFSVSSPLHETIAKTCEPSLDPVDYLRDIEETIAKQDAARTTAAMTTQLITLPPASKYTCKEFLTTFFSLHEQLSDNDCHIPGVAALSIAINAIKEKSPEYSAILQKRLDMGWLDWEDFKKAILSGQKLTPRTPHPGPMWDVPTAIYVCSPPSTPSPEQRQRQRQRQVSPEKHHSPYRQEVPQTPVEYYLSPELSPVSVEGYGEEGQIKEYDSDSDSDIGEVVQLPVHSAMRRSPGSFSPLHPESNEFWCPKESPRQPWSSTYSQYRDFSETKTIDVTNKATDTITNSPAPVVEEKPYDCMASEWALYD
ncbi:Uu.00g120350.m01.CDS01 [Anthostomella pinea]|uniref:Uu.00g120350.m01.CDS01 n=1 Tax=Anthostomella pinea TaxID=933095 RepID=A0AAI8VHB1_9PEZI|nr:Uu.00g120350.m01.CDS01 [Anthostomella pinea]